MKLALTQKPFDFRKSFEQARLATQLSFSLTRSEVFLLKSSYNKNLAVARTTGGHRWSGRKGLEKTNGFCVRWGKFDSVFFEYV